MLKKKNKLKYKYTTAPLRANATQKPIAWYDIVTHMLSMEYCHQYK